MLAAFALLLAGPLSAPAPGASFPPDLTAAWTNTVDSLSTWELQSSADRKTLTAHWTGDVGTTHAGLVGSFTGTLNQSGTAYSGTLHVTEGTNVVNGTMTFTISSQQKLGYPLLNVSFQSDNDTGGSLTLEIYLLRPKVDPGAKEETSWSIGCPGPDPCEGTAGGTFLGSNLSIFRGGTGPVALPAAKVAVVTPVHFSIKAGHSRKITVALNKTGRMLLSKHGSLQVTLLVHTNKSSGLPPVTKVGTVTFHKHKK